MEYLQQYFARIGFNADELVKTLQSFELKKFRKNDMLVMEGRVSRHIGLIESGMFQYYVNKDGQEITSYISTENTWLASVISFIGEKPAKENIRALTDGEVHLISRHDLKKLVADVPAFKDFYMALLEQAICGIDESRHDFITLTADERYVKLLEQEPHLLQQIPLQHLASMLGITPRHLSRIRKNISY